MDWTPVPVGLALDGNDFSGFAPVQLHNTHPARIMLEHTQGLLLGVRATLAEQVTAAEAALEQAQEALDELRDLMAENDANYNGVCAALNLLGKVGTTYGQEDTPPTPVAKANPHCTGKLASHTPGEVRVYRTQRWGVQHLCRTCWDAYNTKRLDVDQLPSKDWDDAAPITASVKVPAAV